MQTLLGFAHPVRELGRIFANIKTKISLFASCEHKTEFTYTQEATILTALNKLLSSKWINSSWSNTALRRDVTKAGKPTQVLCMYDVVNM